MKSSVTQLVELAPALAAVLGADAIRTEDAQLDDYTADTYWPAIAARVSRTLTTSPPMPSPAALPPVLLAHGELLRQRGGHEHLVERRAALERLLRLGGDGAVVAVRVQV